MEQKNWFELIGTDKILEEFTKSSWRLSSLASPFAITPEDKLTTAELVQFYGNEKYGQVIRLVFESKDPAVLDTYEKFVCVYGELTYGNELVWANKTMTQEILNFVNAMNKLTEDLEIEGRKYEEDLCHAIDKAIQEQCQEEINELLEKYKSKCDKITKSITSKILGSTYTL